MAASIEDIRQALRKLGVADAAVCIHSSLRSFGYVEGGAETVVTGFLEEGCTVLVPTFSWAFAVRPPPDLQPARNGTDYDTDAMSDRGRDRIFDAATPELDRQDMGAIPAAVLSIEGHVRGNHPITSFTAIGPLARRLIDAQSPLDMYRPLESLVALRGWIILMGVGLTSMTLLHLAEKLAGRTQFRRWANGSDGRPIMVEVGGCSRGFERFAPLLAPVERDIRVGDSRWRVFPAQETLEIAVGAIRTDPQITTCGDPTCGRCRDAVLGGPILPP